MEYLWPQEKYLNYLGNYEVLILVLMEYLWPSPSSRLRVRFMGLNPCSNGIPMAAAFAGFEDAEKLS